MRMWNGLRCYTLSRFQRRTCSGGGSGILRIIYRLLRHFIPRRDVKASLRAKQLFLSRLLESSSSRRKKKNMRSVQTNVHEQYFFDYNDEMRSVIKAEIYSKFLSIFISLPCTSIYPSSCSFFKILEKVSAVVPRRSASSPFGTGSFTTADSFFF